MTKQIAPKTTRNKKRVAKPIKATYRELISAVLVPGIMMEEEKLLSLVVCKKYMVTRAKKSRRLAVYAKLKDGFELGEFRNAEIGNKTYWRTGDGTPVNETLDQGSSLDNLSVEADARKAAAELEKFFLRVCETRLKDEVKINISYRLRNELTQRLERDSHGKLLISDSSLLKYAGLSDFSWIITDNWHKFADVFENRSDLVAKIRELNSYRRRIAHPNLEPMSEEEYRYFVLSVNLFMRKYS